MLKRELVGYNEDNEIQIIALYGALYIFCEIDCFFLNSVDI